jgi:hypothetical protein
VNNYRGMFRCVQVWAMVQQASAVMKSATGGNACNMDILAWWVGAIDNLTLLLFWRQLPSAWHAFFFFGAQQLL